jgi:hypothetical protein
MNDNLIGGGVAATTGTTGLFHMMAWIPDDIGKLACLVSIMASVIFSANSLYKSRLTKKTTEKLELEIERMKSEMEIENMKGEK